MRRRALLGTSAVAITSLTGCIGRFQNGYILNRLILSEVSGIDQETDQEEVADNIEIIVECDGEEVHTSTHARPIEQPSENEPVVVSDEFPDERCKIDITVQSENTTLESAFETSIFKEYDGYCIDIHVLMWGDRISTEIFDSPYDC